MASNDEFFKEKKPAAVFKHGIISRYPKVFFTKTCKTSTGGRGVYFDAFAGPGRYEDGDKGSPVLAVDMAAAVHKFGRNVTCVFSEKQRKYFKELTANLLRGDSVENVEVHNTTANEQVDHVLELAEGLPLLVFLDPYGAALPFSTVTEKLLRKEEPTELLLNFNVEMFWRAGGLAAKFDGTAEHQASLRAFDTVVGGDWWRSMFADYSKDSGPSAPERAKSVVTEYAKRVRSATGYSSIMTPVRRSVATSPIFYLIFFFRHIDAAWVFTEGHSKALEDWRKACFEVDHAAGDGFTEVFPDWLENEFRDSEIALKEQWEASITANLRSMVDRSNGRRIPLEPKIVDVYGDTLGAARPMHLRAAWKRLASEGLIEPIPKGNKLALQKLSLIPKS